MTTVRMIAGSGRSGTTWILDALANANQLRPVFEPLHPHLSQIGNRYAHQALSADEDHPDLKEFLVRASRGSVERLWTQYRQQLRWLFPPPSRFGTRQDAVRCWRHWAKFVTELPLMTLNGRRGEPLIKCIRANLMLPWLARHLDCRLVLVVRHPGAVVESELRGGWNADFALERFRNDQRLRELTRGRYESLLARRLNPIEALTVRWIIENQWVAESAITNGIEVFHYERLRSSDDREWTRLCAAFDLINRPKFHVLIRPSQQSGAGRKLVPLELSSTPRWMSGLAVEQKDAVRGILDAVGFDTYAMDDPFPRRQDQMLSSIGNSVINR